MIGALAAPPESDEETLKALIDFFRGLTLADADRDKIAALIRDLGADEFRVREMASKELIKIGDAAISLLRQAKEKTGASGGHQNIPVEDVTIKSVRVVR